MTSLSLFRSSSAVSQFCMRISEPNLPQRAFNVFLSSLPVAYSKKYNRLLISNFVLKSWSGHKKLWWCSFTSRALRMFKAVSFMHCLHQLCPTRTTNHWSKSLYGWHCLVYRNHYLVGRAWEKLEFQLVLWSSSSHILLAWGHFLLVLVND